VRLVLVAARNTSKRGVGVIVVPVIFGTIVLALATGAILMAPRLGWNLRLLSLVGAPVGIACDRFLIRGHAPIAEWRQSLPAIVIAIGVVSSVLNLAFGVSRVFAVFTLSAAAALAGVAFLRLLGQMRVLKMVLALVESAADDDSPA
jgi:hypothetical protein